MKLTAIPSANVQDTRNRKEPRPTPAFVPQGNPRMPNNPFPPKVKMPRLGSPKTPLSGVSPAGMEQAALADKVAIQWLRGQRHGDPAGGPTGGFPGLPGLPGFPFDLDTLLKSLNKAAKKQARPNPFDTKKAKVINPQR